MSFSTSSKEYFLISLQSVFNEMSQSGLPNEVITSMKDMLDCNMYFFGYKVDILVMYLILIGSVVALVAAYIIMNSIKKKI